MSRSLCEAALLAQYRRLSGTGRRRLLAAALVVVAWLAAPAAAWRLGATLGEMLAPALADAAAARALALGLCLTCAAVGAAVGVALPGPAALGAQLVSAPVSRRSLTLAANLPVATGIVVLVGPLLVALLLPVAAVSPGGRSAAAVVLASLAGAGVAGAVLGEGARRVFRRGSTFAWAIAAAGGATLAVLAVESASVALAGGRFGALLGGATLVGMLCSGRLWLGLVATRPEPVHRPPRRVVTTPGRRPGAAVVVSAAALLARPPDLRGSLFAAAAFGLLGLAVGAATGAPPAAGALLGGGSCAVASCFVPLAVRGRMDPGAWVWRVTRRWLVATAWAAASLALVESALLPVQLVALAQPGDAGAAVAQVAALAVLAWASALAAGAVVPRRARGAGDDALALGAFTAIAVLLGSATAGAGTRLDAWGLPGAVAACLTLAAAAVAAVAVLCATWGRR